MPDVFDPPTPPEAEFGVDGWFGVDGEPPKRFDPSGPLKLFWEKLG